mgnify:CR=1 FL=1
MSLGLAKSVTRLEPHDPAWARQFEQERERLGRVLLDAPCEHIGSTAVPGLAAKPILDLAVGCPADFAGLRQGLEGAGYLYMGDGGDEGGHLFVRESAPEVRTHHLHVVRYAGPQWQGYLALRDLLRRSADARARYEGVKRDLARLHPLDRPAYTDGKTGCITELLRRRR